MAEALNCFHVCMDCFQASVWEKGGRLNCGEFMFPLATQCSKGDNMAQKFAGDRIIFFAAWWWSSTETG